MPANEPHSSPVRQTWAALTTLRSIADAVITTDTQGLVELLNPVAEALTGWKNEDARGQPLDSIFHIIDEETHEELENLLELVVRDGQIVKLPSHATLLARDGTAHPIADSSAPIRDDQGAIIGVVLVFRDQTGERAAQRTLYESQRMLSNVLDTIPVRVFWKNLEGKYLGCNAPFARDSGFSAPDELIGKDDSQMGWKQEAERYRADDRQVIETGIPKIGYEEPQTMPNGDSLWLRTSKIPLRDAEGRTIGILGTYEDITPRKRAEAALRREQALFKDLISSIPDNIYFKDRKSRFVCINNAMAKGFGMRSPDEATGKTDFDVFSEEHARQAYENDQRIMSSGESLIGHLEKETWPDGHITWVSTTKVPLRDADGNITGLVGVSRDITKRKQTEERVREQAALLDNANDAIYVRRLDRTITYWNRGAAQLYGWSATEAVDRKETDLFLLAGAELAEADRALLAQSSWAGEMHHAVKNGEIVTVFCRWSLVRDDQGIPQLVFAIHSDVSEKKRLEAQFFRAQKLEGLGVLAGGIAHDFNNLLTAILGHANLALMDLAPDAPARDSLREIEKASIRAAELCRQMLAYAGKGQFVVESINLSRLIEELAHLLNISISKKVLLRCQLAEELPAIEADPVQMRQVAMNLVINAAEAIGDTAGVIAISTGVMECDEEYLRGGLVIEPPAPGRYVYLEVTDTGCGMDAKTRAKIFEPFFTTKFAGRGLGLAAVLGIVRGHRGMLKVESELGRGSTFRVLFPASAKTATTAASSGSPWRWRGDGTVLLVDDEEAVRNVAGQMLERCGFTVLCARDGREAVELFAARASEIVCVLLDLAMPGMDGEETFRELRRIQPSVRVILASGYGNQEIANRFRGAGLAGMIEKPYQMKALGTKLREALAPDA
jgi:PAS domain S-box-containing protein